MKHVVAGWNRGIHEPLSVRMARYTTPEPMSGCWLWSGRSDKDGYGSLGKSPWEPKREVRAHRLAWVMANGPIPPGLFVCHKCDNPACVNVDHLFLGTLQDNVDDMVRKGRRTITRFEGEAHPRAKLTDRLVLEMRAKHRSGAGFRQLGRDYGVHYLTARSAVIGETWTHLN